MTRRNESKLVDDVKVFKSTQKKISIPKKLVKSCRVLKSYIFIKSGLSKYFILKTLHGTGGRISWDQNSTFSGGRIFDHEIEIQFVHEIKLFCKIDQEIELALGALRELG